MQAHPHPTLVVDLVGNMTTRSWRHLQYLWVCVFMLQTGQDQVEASVQDFDRALQLSPQMRPYLWQRGLSLYYLGEYQEAAKQFR